MTMSSRRRWHSIELSVGRHDHFVERKSLLQQTREPYEGMNFEPCMDDGADGARRVIHGVAAAQPDVGESLADLADKMPPANKSIGRVGDGFLAVDPDAFPNDFAADARKALARFMAISQVLVAAGALHAKATVAPRKEKPSYAVVATQDRMINLDLERFMAKRSQSQVIELPGSHAHQAMRASLATIVSGKRWRIARAGTPPTTV
jgi:hypothetical protein